MSYTWRSSVTFWKLLTTPGARKHADLKEGRRLLK